MKVRVSLYSVLRRYAPGGEESAAVELPRGSRVADLLQALGVPAEAERIVLVDGRNALDDEVLPDGATVALFPPVAGG